MIVPGPGHFLSLLLLHVCEGTSSFLGTEKSQRLEISDKQRLYYLGF